MQKLLSLLASGAMLPILFCPGADKFDLLTMQQTMQQRPMICRFVNDHR